MKDYQKYIYALRKCANEHDNDTTYTGHIIVSDLCRATAILLEALEQEPKTETWSIKDVANTFKKYGLIKEQESDLDKIRAEIVHFHDWAFSREEILRLIDKYIAESEG